MKNRLFAFLAFSCALSLAAAQDAPSFGEATGKRYLVLSERGRDAAAALLGRLEAGFDLYNGVLRFDPETLKSRLNVREFKDKTGFESYLKQVAGQSRDDFVYLHYPTGERSELVIYAKDEPDYSASLGHQAFVQFLKAFVPNPPLWLREGLAVWFESARWDEKAGKFEFPENLAWLETVKSLKDRNLLMSLDRLLEIGPDEARSQLDVFYPQSWAFVSFLANSPDRAYNRLLWDSLAALRSASDLAANQAAIARIYRSWYAKSAEKDFLAYLGERKTFPELVAAGVRKYGDKAWDEAAVVFEAARESNPGSYVPHYYLGLIAYAKNDFTQSELRYRTALQLGCDPAIVNYALGVSFIAQNRIEDARASLVKAREAAPDRYGSKVDELLAKFPK